jgi:hypothetical protein
MEWKEFEVSRCRSCGHEKFLDIISLGSQYVTNFIEGSNDGHEKYPLKLLLCEKCNLLQLKHNIPPESMWGDQYWYKSGISTTIKNDLRNIVESVIKIKELNEGDIVIDIGCNDGTLLEGYKENLKRVGFEPSKNVANESSAKGLKVINDFFNSEKFKKEFGEKKAKVITAISMFYDLDDPNKFLEDIIECLDREGLFVIQQNYLLTMLENNAFDNICHEHREYYSLSSLKKLLEKHNLEVFDVSQNEINGGSIRTYIKIKGNENLKGFKGAEERIKEIEDEELRVGLNTLKPYREFAERIENVKKELLDFILEEKKKGKKFWVYGASTRGNVALQYFGLNQELIEGIVDKNPDKEGKKTIGSLIPIHNPKRIYEDKPDYLIIMIWYFAEEVIKQERRFSNQGGKFIVPLPEFKVMNL